MFKVVSAFAFCIDMATCGCFLTVGQVGISLWDNKVILSDEDFFLVPVSPFELGGVGNKSKK